MTLTAEMSCHLPIFPLNLLRSKAKKVWKWVQAGEEEVQGKSGTLQPITMNSPLYAKRVLCFSTTLSQNFVAVMYTQKYFQRNNWQFLR